MPQHDASKCHIATQPEGFRRGMAAPDCREPLRLAVDHLHSAKVAIRGTEFSIRHDLNRIARGEIGDADGPVISLNVGSRVVGASIHGVLRVPDGQFVGGERNHVTAQDADGHDYLSVNRRAQEKHGIRPPVHVNRLYNLSLNTFLEQAGSWFLHSGIQEPTGGVARYYLSDAGKNAPVSTEITGYALSAFAYLYSLDSRPEYRDAVKLSGQYLSTRAWDPVSNTFPFEPGSPHAYFFDMGIIVRGLMAAWRCTGEEEFRARARDAALSLAFDFLGDRVFHPIVSLPEKQPLDYEPRWSRSPGCYQLKSALAWLDVNDEHAAKLFEKVLAYSLETHETFLPGESDREKVMDRLHAYCYFLEALLAVGDREPVRAALRHGIARVAALLREIAPEFERSDVCAQLLRVRLIAHHSDWIALDERAACEEADRAASYQDDSGGFWFGQKRGKVLPFLNPVSTAFCLQALALWRQHQGGSWRFQLHELI